MNIILFEEFPLHQIIPNKDPRGQHIRKVLHLEVGGKFRMGIVNGASGIATITGMDSSGISYDWLPENQPIELYKVTLLVAQIRPICMKRILREAVSIGVEHILVVGSDTGERSYAEAKLWSTGEYRKYLIDGAMQSGKTGMATLHLEQNLDKALDSCDWKTKIVLDTVPAAKPLSKIRGVSEPVVLAIGPERGWSDRERSLFLQHNFETRSFGDRILRTETACPSALAVLLGIMGHLS